MEGAVEGALRLLVGSAEEQERFVRWVFEGTQIPIQARRGRGVEEPFPLAPFLFEPDPGQGSERFRAEVGRVVVPFLLSHPARLIAIPLWLWEVMLKARGAGGEWWMEHVKGEPGTSLLEAAASREARGVHALIALLLKATNDDGTPRAYGPGNVRVERGDWDASLWESNGAADGVGPDRYPRVSWALLHAIRVDNAPSVEAILGPPPEVGVLLTPPYLIREVIRAGASRVMDALLAARTPAWSRVWARFGAQTNHQDMMLTALQAGRIPIALQVLRDGRTTKQDAYNGARVALAIATGYPGRGNEDAEHPRPLLFPPPDPSSSVIPFVESALREVRADPSRRPDDTLTLLNIASWAPTVHSNPLMFDTLEWIVVHLLPPPKDASERVTYLGWAAMLRNDTVLAIMLDSVAYNHSVLSSDAEAHLFQFAWEYGRLGSVEVLLQYEGFARVMLNGQHPWSKVSRVLTVLQAWRAAGEPPSLVDAASREEAARDQPAFGTWKFYTMVVDVPGTGVIAASMRVPSFREGVTPALVEYAAAQGRYDVVRTMLAYGQVRAQLTAEEEERLYAAMEDLEDEDDEDLEDEGEEDEDDEELEEEEELEDEDEIPREELPRPLFRLPPEFNPRPVRRGPP